MLYAIIIIIILGIANLVIGITAPFKNSGVYKNDPKAVKKQSRTFIIAGVVVILLGSLMLAQKLALG